MCIATIDLSGNYFGVFGQLHTVFLLLEETLKICLSNNAISSLVKFMLCILYIFLAISHRIKPLNEYKFWFMKTRYKHSMTF